MKGQTNVGQRDVVRALTMAGATVRRQGRQGLLVGYQRRNYLLGVGGEPMEGWGGQFKAVTNAADVFKALGIPARRAKGFLAKLEGGTTATTTRTRGKRAVQAKGATGRKRTARKASTGIRKARGGQRRNVQQPQVEHIGNGAEAHH